ncbi:MULTISPECIES: NAD(P)H-dependent glycerol-3-phosphate dehydrogenase [Bombella]|uniref:Glycerol-3-phosphate dehydrogenase [NAD(P)+] n=1 Tax=Bombella pollinis TaxID=2967337 RepID=A0ABT3WL49_9PROT|nr:MULTISPECIES: NAD(P)H-dependent glycerol-3-phosphate dehydrogenase [Bombella]MCX5619776.1 NAD(P)-dependent glycerol-3-phosphate dehydrogenase [Bombella pollinis]MUG04485.1 NAD(P)H-dependent glycerol-3-phosphate dehydrogenase [Bombella sp. ESL0378]
MTAPPRIAVIGAGAWGIALACSLAPIATVSLWTRTPVPAGTRNMPHLPQVTVPESVTISSSLPSEADIVLLVVPTQGLRDTSLALQKQLAAHVPVVTCCKGMEQGTFLLPLEVLAQTMPGRPAAVLSGPNFAIEVAQGMPSAATLATEDAALSAQLTQALTTPSLRLYASTDPLGVQLAGAAKNVIAIGAGISVGAGMGENARAAIITRALAETARLVEAMGGQGRTMYGLAGMGDLILTATGAGSRNYSLGVAMGKGENIDDILARRNTVAEGVLTAPTLRELGRRFEIDTPIINVITRLLSGELTPHQARDELLDRPPCFE